MFFSHLKVFEFLEVVGFRRKPSKEEHEAMNLSLKVSSLKVFHWTKPEIYQQYLWKKTVAICWFSSWFLMSWRRILFMNAQYFLLDLNFHLWDSQSESFFARSLQEALRWWWSRGRESLHLVIDFLFQNWSLSVNSVVIGSQIFKKLSDKVCTTFASTRLLSRPPPPKRKSSSLSEISAVGSRKWIAGSWICRKSCWKTARGECWIPMPSCSHDLGWFLDCLTVCFLPNIDTSGFQKKLDMGCLVSRAKKCAICVFHWLKKCSLSLETDLQAKQGPLCWRSFGSCWSVRNKRTSESYCTS